MGYLIPSRSPDVFGRELDSPYFVPQPESAETAIARQNPSIASDLLKYVSRKILDKNLAESAAGIAGVYLQCMKEVKAPALRESSQLSLTILKESTKGKVSNFFFGEKEIGFSITIKLN
jgi:hypothetical protein